jgi:hypothetical protein
MDEGTPHTRRHNTPPSKLLTSGLVAGARLPLARNPSRARGPEPYDAARRGSAHARGGRVCARHAAARGGAGGVRGRSKPQQQRAPETRSAQARMFVRITHVSQGQTAPTNRRRRGTGRPSAAERLRPAKLVSVRARVRCGAATAPHTPRPAAVDKPGRRHGRAACFGPRAGPTSCAAPTGVCVARDSHKLPAQCIRMVSCKPSECHQRARVAPGWRWARCSNRSVCTFALAPCGCGDGGGGRRWCAGRRGGDARLRCSRQRAQARSSCAWCRGSARCASCWSSTGARRGHSPRRSLTS